MAPRGTTTMRRHLLPLAAVALLALASAAGASEAPGGVLGSDGELYAVKAGLYGELFAGGTAAAANNPVLALEIVRPDAVGAQRLLVPGTEGAEEENSPSIYVDRRSGSTYLIWESRSSFIHSKIRLIQYAGGEWSEPITLLGNRFNLKSSPQLTVTRNPYEYIDDQGAVVHGDRTIFHTIWREETDSGLVTVYAPVILLDGEYTGATASTTLDQFLPAVPAGVPAEVAEGLLYSVTIAPGSDNQSVVVAFTDRLSGQVVSLSLGVLPTELSALADAARAQIIEVGNRPGGRQALAGAARAQIIEVGRRLRARDRLVEYVADAASELIAAAPEDEPLENLAGSARAQIIEVGATLDRGGLRRRNTVGGSFLMEIDEPGAAPAPIPVSRSHHLEVLVASRRPAPEIGDGAAHLYVSDTGEDLLVAWQEGDFVRYRESSADGWSDVQSLHLTGDLDLEQAQEILQRRVRLH